jgi:cation:H+ antiporter
VTALLQQAGFAVTSLVFVVATVTVWFGGTALCRNADAIAARTGLGRAFVGVLFLGIATSMPEVATTAGAVLEGYPTLAGTNLLGGISMQIAVLALVDGLALRGKALTHFSGNPAFLMQGVILALILALGITGIAIGDRALIGGLGTWPVVFAAVYVLALFVMYRYERNPRWQPVGPAPARGSAGARTHGAGSNRSLRAVLFRFAAAAGVVFVSGYAVAISAAALTEWTGLDQTVVGATLVALATSLPEVSTTWSAVRMGAYAMAVGNIFGTNALELALFLPADVLHTAAPILNSLDSRAAFLGALGIILTCIYLWGVLERRDRVVLGFGIDSALVLLVYSAGLVLLYFAA